MISCALSLVFGGFLAQAADNIKPDWKKLTDFSTGIKVNLDSVIQVADEEGKRDFEECTKYNPYDHDFCRHKGIPVRTAEAAYNVQLDVSAERFKIAGTVNVEFADSDSIPGPLRGQKASGTATIAFDAAAGFIYVKEKGSVSSQMGPFDYEFCARAHFPKGLLPPGQMIMAQLDRHKQQVTEHLNQFPHTDATVDGNSVAVYSPPHEPHKPSVFAAIMHDGTPVGVGINNAPSGTWEDASVKFNGWTTGAGTITDEPCVTMMSATELLQSHHANRSLWVFDQVMDLMNKQEPLTSVLAFVPLQPSKIFESAARIESLEASSLRFNEDAKVEISSVSSWATMAIAAVGGVIGASLVLVLSKTRASMRRPELLG